jgi:transposase
MESFKSIAAPSYRGSHNIVTLIALVCYRSSMGNAAGVRRDFEALERRRLRAAGLLKRGVDQSEVARQVGVHRQSVSRWARRLQADGRAGLKKAGRAGRKPHLTTVDFERIEQGLKRGAESLGYETGLWTSARVAHLIARECGVEYHPGHVWRILRRLGWSCQRPVGRALERDEVAIGRWKRKRWPEIKKKLKKKIASSSSSMKAD